MLDETLVSSNLLFELREAAWAEDFEDTARLLKRMLQPFGVHCSGESDRFTGEDVRQLGCFWRQCLDLRPEEAGIARAAMPLFSTISSASVNRGFIELGADAKEKCKRLVSVCNDLIEKPRILSSVIGAGVKIRYAL